MDEGMVKVQIRLSRLVDAYLESDGLYIEIPIEDLVFSVEGMREFAKQVMERGESGQTIKPLFRGV